MEKEDMTQETTIEDTTSTDSSTENKETTTTEESSTQDKTTEDANKNVPFHEDPKIQEYISRQVDSRIDGELQKRFSSKEEKDVEIPKWFGGDKEQWEAYQESQAEILAQAEERAVKRIEERKKAEEDLLKAANDWFEENVASLEKAGEKVDRNLLLKTAIDEELIDSQGRWNYKAAFKILKGSKTEDDSNLDERKEFAAANTTTTTKAEPKAKDFKTTDDFKGKNWANL